MQRFEQNSAVFILPKFAKLYPGQSAIVADVTPDPYRSMFDAYTVRFADGSTSRVFDFQMIEDMPDHETFIATLALDSQQELHETHARRPQAKQQIVLQSPGFELLMNVRADKSRALIVGRVVERDTDNVVEPAEIRLMKDGIPLSTARQDGGAFKFSDVSRGSLNILVVVPKRRARILGAFSI